MRRAIFCVNKLSGLWLIINLDRGNSGLELIDNKRAMFNNTKVKGGLSAGNFILSFPMVAAVVSTFRLVRFCLSHRNELVVGSKAFSDFLSNTENAFTSDISNCIWLDALRHDFGPAGSSW
ncbi:MAG TPA: hypothetical protein VMB78_11870 [Dissulfurispiraceae bacterium]|nr:hypothetical protein [Dissulfurispiraceae bacterium]